MLHPQGLDTTTPAGKAMLQMMGVFAEFERAMIRERVKAAWSGLAPKATADGCDTGVWSELELGSSEGRLISEMEELVRLRVAVLAALWAFDGGTICRWRQTKFAIRMV